MSEVIHPPVRMMGFVEAVRTCLLKYATLRGRARRSEYWFFVLFYWIVLIGAVILDVVIETGENFPIAVVASLGLVLPHLAASIRRFHDSDHSGWWYALNFVPLVNIVFAIVQLIWLCQPGSDGSNRYGPAPEDPDTKIASAFD